MVKGLRVYGIYGNSVMGLKFIFIVSKGERKYRMGFDLVG